MTEYAAAGCVVHIFFHPVFGEGGCEALWKEIGRSFLKRTELARARARGRMMAREGKTVNVCLIN
jgi:hypothetical protein